MITTTEQLATDDQKRKIRELIVERQYQSMPVADVLSIFDNVAADVTAEYAAAFIETLSGNPLRSDPARPTNPASEKQINFLQTLLVERQYSGPLVSFSMLSKRDASDLIERLLASPRASKPATQTITKPGVFRTGGQIYIVKPNRAKTAMYAMRLVEINGDRLTEAGTVVRFETYYAPGIVSRLTEADRLSFQEGKELSIRYGRCICCNRTLRNAVSVERGIGPICAGYFA